MFVMLHVIAFFRSSILHIFEEMCILQTICRRLDFLPLEKSSVNLENPTNVFMIIEETDLTASSDQPKVVLFGRLVRQFSFGSASTLLNYTKFGGSNRESGQFSVCVKD